MTNLITHKLYLLSRIRKYITKNASIASFKTVILSLIEYGDVIYMLYNNKRLREILWRDCHIAPLDVRREMQLLLFMHKKTNVECLLKKSRIRTRLHQAPVL